MEYNLGSEKDFHGFLRNISGSDKVGIVTHTDVDGIISGIFLRKILESRKANISFMEFLDYGHGVLKPILKKDFDYLIFSDWNADNYEGDLGLLREKGKVLVVDHHPLNENLKDKSGLIKTESYYCSSHALFDYAKNYFDTKNFEKFLHAALICDYTFRNDEVFGILKSAYPEISREDIFESVPGKFGREIDNVVIYFKPNYKKAYDLILEGDFGRLQKISASVEEEARICEEKYLKEAEYFPEKNFYFGFVNPKYSFTSKVISKISSENPDKIFIVASETLNDKNLVKASSRCQSGDVDLGQLLKKCVEGFENSSAGGHVRAASSSFPKRYLEEFKERLIKNL